MQQSSLLPSSRQLHIPALINHTACSHSPRWLLCTQRVNGSPPHTTHTDVTLGCSRTPWNASLGALMGSHFLTKTSGDLVALCGSPRAARGRDPGRLQMALLWSCWRVCWGNSGCKSRRIEGHMQPCKEKPSHCNAGWVGGIWSMPCISFCLSTMKWTPWTPRVTVHYTAQRGIFSLIPLADKKKTLLWGMLRREISWLFACKAHSSILFAGKAKLSCWMKSTFKSRCKGVSHHFAELVPRGEWSAWSV